MEKYAYFKHLKLKWFESVAPDRLKEHKNLVFVRLQESS